MKTIMKMFGMKVDEIFAELRNYGTTELRVYDVNGEAR